MNWGPEGRSNLVQLVIGIEEGSGDFYASDVHDSEDGDHDAPVADCEEVV